MDLVHDRGSMDPVHESGPWTRSKVGVHGPLVHVLSSPVCSRLINQWNSSLLVRLFLFDLFSGSCVINFKFKRKYAVQQLKLPRYLPHATISRKKVVKAKSWLRSFKNEESPNLKDRVYKPESSSKISLSIEYDLKRYTMRYQESDLHLVGLYSSSTSANNLNLPTLLTLFYFSTLLYLLVQV